VSGALPPPLPPFPDNVSYTYAFDALNRAVSVANNSTNFRTGYDYDAAGNRARQSMFVGGTGPWSTTQYVYDGKNRRTAIRDSVVGNFKFAYDPDRRTSLQYPRGVTTSYAYERGTA
jgi:YD repeat-containing protein